MEIDMLDKVKNLQEQYDKAKQILENQERQIIQFLIGKNREILEDNNTLRSEIKTLKSENYSLLMQNQLLSCGTVEQQFVRPYQTETFMCIPGDRSPPDYLSPNNLSMESIYDSSDQNFPEYALEVTKVLNCLRKQVNRDKNENQILVQKITDLKTLNEQLWSEIIMLRKRSNQSMQFRQYPRPNTPGMMRLSSPSAAKGIFSQLVSPVQKLNVMTPKSRESSPDVQTPLRRFFN